MHLVTVLAQLGAVLSQAVGKRGAWRNGAADDVVEQPGGVHLAEAAQRFVDKARSGRQGIGHR